MSLLLPIGPPPVSISLGPRFAITGASLAIAASTLITPKLACGRRCRISPPKLCWCTNGQGKRLLFLAAAPAIALRTGVLQKPW